MSQELRFYKNAGLLAKGLNVVSNAATKAEKYIGKKLYSRNEGRKYLLEKMKKMPVSERSQYKSTFQRLRADSDEQAKKIVGTGKKVLGGAGILAVGKGIDSAFAGKEKTAMSQELRFYKNAGLLDRGLNVVRNAATKAEKYIGKELYQASGKRKALLEKMKKGPASGNGYVPNSARKEEFLKLRNKSQEQAEQIVGAGKKVLGGTAAVVGAKTVYDTFAGKGKTAMLSELGFHKVAATRPEYPWKEIWGNTTPTVSYKRFKDEDLKDLEYTVSGRRTRRNALLGAALGATLGAVGPLAGGLGVGVAARNAARVGTLIGLVGAGLSQIGRGKARKLLADEAAFDEQAKRNYKYYKDYKKLALG